MPFTLWGFIPKRTQQHRHLRRIRLLADLEEQPDADIESAGPNGDPAAWDTDKLTKLATTKLSNTKTVARVLDILCEQPGRQYDMQDLVQALPLVGGRISEP